MTKHESEAKAGGRDRPELTEDEVVRVFSRYIAAFIDERDLGEAAFDELENPAQLASFLVREVLPLSGHKLDARSAQVRSSSS
jgi:hypothetical protein